MLLFFDPVLKLLNEVAKTEENISIDTGVQE